MLDASGPVGSCVAIAGPSYRRAGLCGKQPIEEVEVVAHHAFGGEVTLDGSSARCAVELANPIQGRGQLLDPVEDESGDPVLDDLRRGARAITFSPRRRSQGPCRRTSRTASPARPTAVRCPRRSTPPCWRGSADSTRRSVSSPWRAASTWTTSTTARPTACTPRPSAACGRRWCSASPASDRRSRAWWSTPTSQITGSAYACTCASAAGWSRSAPAQTASRCLRTGRCRSRWVATSRWRWGPRPGAGSERRKVGARADRHAAAARARRLTRADAPRESPSSTGGAPHGASRGQTRLVVRRPATTRS